MWPTPDHLSCDLHLISCHVTYTWPAVMWPTPDLLSCDLHLNSDSELPWMLDTTLDSLPTSLWHQYGRASSGLLQAVTPSSDWLKLLCMTDNRIAIHKTSTSVTSHVCAAQVHSTLSPLHLHRWCRHYGQQWSKDRYVVLIVWRLIAMLWQLANRSWWAYT